MLQASISRNVETSNSDEPPAAVMKNQKGKEHGELPDLERVDMGGGMPNTCSHVSSREMFIPD